MFFPSFMMAMFIGMIVSLITGNPIFIVMIPVFSVFMIFAVLYINDFVRDYLKKRIKRLEKETSRLEKYCSAISSAYSTVEKIIQNEIIVFINEGNDLKEMCLSDSRDRASLSRMYSNIRSLEKDNE